MTEQWQELKETIIELRDNNGTSTQQEVCKFLTNLMDVLEKQMQEPKTEKWIRELIRNEKGGCIGAKMICSKCGNDNKHDEYMNYCPNCGACMKDCRTLDEFIEARKAREYDKQNHIKSKET